MNTFSQKVFSPRQMEYLTVDSDFNIIEKSWEVERFADCPDEVTIGNDVRLGFPELFGLEDILNDILEERQISFDLDGVARYLDNKLPLYIDIHITKKQTGTQDNELIIFIKDVTSKSL
ncbi:MAG: adenylate/guanylate cyclase, partial [Coleofasciculaceae cyanobacterium]